MKIKNNDYTLKVKGLILNRKIIKALKNYKFTIYWNDLECYHWMFDKKIDIPGYNDLWLENIELSNDLQNMKCLVVMK